MEFTQEHQLFRKSLRKFIGTEINSFVEEEADTCILFHGGMGYMEEYLMARCFRDARLVSIGGGAGEVMLGIIAKFEGILPSRRKKE